MAQFNFPIGISSVQGLRKRLPIAKEYAPNTFGQGDIVSNEFCTIEDGDVLTIRTKDPITKENVDKSVTFAGSSPALGKALQFPDSSGHVTVGDKASLDFNTGFSVEGWLFIPTGAVMDGAIVDKQTGGIYQGYCLMTADANSELGWFVNAGWKGKFGFTAYKDVWVYFVAKWTGTQYIIKINLDIKSSAPSTDAPNSAGSIFKIGKAQDGHVVNGMKIDELRIYNRPTTDEEDTYNYGGGAGTYTPFSTSGLVGWWHMDEGTGTLVADSSTSGYDGTLTGDPLPTWINGKVFIGGSLTWGDIKDQITASEIVTSGLWSCAIPEQPPEIILQVASDFYAASITTDDSGLFTISYPEFTGGRRGELITIPSSWDKTINVDIKESYKDAFGWHFDNDHPESTPFNYDTSTGIISVYVSGRFDDLVNDTIRLVIFSVPVLGD
jgi:hypothetical protein